MKQIFRTEEFSELVNEAAEDILFAEHGLGINANSQTPTVPGAKKMSHAQKAAFLNTATYEETLQYKNKMEQMGYDPDYSVYAALMSKGESLDIAFDLKNEMEIKGVNFGPFCYRHLLRHCWDDQQIWSIWLEIKNKGFVPDVKLFQIIIAKSSVDQGLIFLDVMTELGLNPDERIIGTIMQIAWKTGRSEEATERIAVYRQKIKIVNSLMMNTTSSEIYSMLCDAGAEKDISFFNIVVASIATPAVRMELITRVTITMNYQTYLAVLFTGVIDGGWKELSKQLQYVLSRLDVAEVSRLIDHYWGKARWAGGRSLVTSKTESLAKTIHFQSLEAEDEREQLYLIGLRAGIKSDEIDSINDNILNHDREIYAMKEDADLFELNIRYEEGYVCGLKALKNIVSEVASMKIPILFIGVIEDEEKLHRLRIDAVKAGFFPYDETTLNKYCLNGFILEDSVEEIVSSLEIIDYSKYDVAINVFADQSEEYILFLQKESINVEKMPPVRYHYDSSVSKIELLYDRLCVPILKEFL